MPRDDVSAPLKSSRPRRLAQPADISFTSRRDGRVPIGLPNRGADTFQASIVDVYDANANLLRSSALFNKIESRITGTTVAGQQVFNTQTGNFAVANISFQKSPIYTEANDRALPDDIFNPQSIAAAASYYTKRHGL